MSSIKKQIVEVIGWVGVVLIVGAFGLNVLGLLDVGHIVYLLMNLSGAAGVMVSSVSKKDLQPVVINSVWLLVSLMGIVRAVFS